MGRPMTDGLAKLTPEACRAARALLNWKTRDLQREAGLSPNTLADVENGRPFTSATEAKIIAAFARYNITIISGREVGAKMRLIYGPN